MAVPAYTEDLTDIGDLAETTTNYGALGGGGAGLAADPDFAIQGTNAITKQVTGAGTQKGIIYDNAATITMGANDHIFAWVYATCPGLLDLLTNSGMSVTIGSSDANYNDYAVAGNDSFIKGGHVCWPIRYATGIPSPGSQTGTPTADPQVFGGQLKVTGVLRAANLSVDASRYGTGAYITAGEIANPATFDGFAVQNDLVLNQWGILTAVAGGYGLQGRFVIGQDNAGLATLAYFSDSDVNITFTDTPHSQIDFTQVIVDHTSSTLIWTNINFTALGTNNRGKVVFNNASTVGTITGGTWLDIGETTLRAGITVDGTTWRGADLVTSNAASLTNVLLDKSTSASSILVADLSEITVSDFISDGSNNGVELSTIGSGSMSWSNNTTGYDAGATGSPVTPTATGNEDIYITATTGTVTINVAAGATVPSIRSAGATVNVVAGQVTLSVETQNGNEVRFSQGSFTLQQTQNTTGGQVDYTYTFAAGTTVSISVGASGFIRKELEYTLLSVDASLLLELDPDPSYI